jgi:hypothetical protein
VQKAKWFQVAHELTKEETMNSCFSFAREKNTEEVIPAKQVIAAVLTYQR